jgi:hypothetical protein
LRKYFRQQTRCLLEQKWQERAAGLEVLEVEADF